MKVILSLAFLYPFALLAQSVGIGVVNPVEKLEVNGKVYSKSGGFKFPDGTVQTSAALTTTGTESSNETELVTVNPANAVEREGVFLKSGDLIAGTTTIQEMGANQLVHPLLFYQVQSSKAYTTSGSQGYLVGLPSLAPSEFSIDMTHASVMLLDLYYKTGPLQSDLVFYEKIAGSLDAYKKTTYKTCTLISADQVFTNYPGVGLRSYLNVKFLYNRIETTFFNPADGRILQKTCYDLTNQTSCTF